MKKSLLPFLFFIPTISISFAQTPLLNFHNNKDYGNCVTEADKNLGINSKDSTAHYFKGLCLMKSGEYKTALISFSAAEQFNFQPINAVHVGKAKCYAQLGQKEKAIQWLDTLVNNGFAIYSVLENNLFEPLKTDSKFIKIKQSIYESSFPCYTDPNYLKMDFWLGEWDVYVGKNKVGENSITKQKGGCMIFENYSTPRDFVGQSINFFDTSDNLWKQIWIDKSKTIYKFSERESKEGYMQFQTAIDTINNNPVYRMTFTKNKDDSVQQFIEISADNAAAWQPAFNGLYKKK